VDELLIIRTQMGTYSGSERVTVHGMPYVIHPTTVTVKTSLFKLLQDGYVMKKSVFIFRISYVRRLNTYMLYIGIIITSTKNNVFLRFMIYFQ
jgi:hypothetical protein